MLGALFCSCPHVECSRRISVGINIRLYLPHSPCNTLQTRHADWTLGVMRVKKKYIHYRNISLALNMYKGVIGFT